MASNSSFSPNSFFFTDPTAFTQSAGQAFGPVSEDIFRLTSKFTVTVSDTNAYAVCSGVILVQPQTSNSNLVNIILRPFEQPIVGFNIKYFIYRGLNIGDFFNGANVIPADENTSDFINKINNSFSAYYTTTAQTAPDFLSKFIGFDPPNQPDSTLISDIFYKITEYTDSTQQTETDQTAFELPVIGAGLSLGTFNIGECGIDIIIDYGDFQLPSPTDQFIFDLSYARTAEKTIDLTTISDDFQQKLLKEQIFQFIDVAAYYGFHYSNGIVMVNNNGSNINKTGDDIYNSLLQNFNTKNNFYLYIQSDRSRSYNFYGNYQISDTDDSCLNIGIAVDALTEITYDTSGWPILINNSTQPTTDGNNILYVQFVTDNNENTVLYGQVAQIINAQGNNFSGPDDIQLTDNEDGTPSNFSKIFQLSNPSIGSSGSNSYVATFNILIYQGKTYDFVVGEVPGPNNTTIDATGQLSFLDQIFDNLNATSLIKNSDGSDYSMISLRRLKVINHFSGGKQYGILAVGTTIISDSIQPDNTTTINRIIYVTESVNLFNNAISSTGATTSDTSSSASVSQPVTATLTYVLPSPYSITFQTFTDGSNTINGVELITTDNSIPNKFVVGLIKSENDLLLALLTSNTMTNTHLYFTNFSVDDTYTVSAEGVNYKKYSLGIIGELSSGKLSLLMPATDIIIYTTDELYYFSLAYSQNMAADTSSISGDTNDDIDDNEQN